MEGLLILGLVVAALLVFSTLAVTFGVDSRRDSNDDRAPAGGLYA
jgi:hypothetical protein